MMSSQRFLHRAGKAYRSMTVSPQPVARTTIRVDTTFCFFLFRPSMSLSHKAYAVEQ